MKDKMVPKLLIMVSLTALTFGCNVVYAIPNIHARSIALKFLEDVIGVDMANFHVISFTASTARMPNSPHYQTDIKVVIANTTSQFEAFMTLVDAKMWTYSLQGEFRNNNLIFWDSLKVANKSLASYQKFVGASNYNRFIGMLSKAIEAKNQHTEDEEVVLNISYTENCFTQSDYMESTVIRFTRKVNGYRLPGDYFMLSVSKDGLLTHIVDNTIFYVATSVINVTMEQAINKALSYAEVYARPYGQKVVAVNATLEFSRDVGCTRGDNFAMYPQWTVWVTLDKVNEENVYAYAVMIWADNGEVYHHSPQGFYKSSSGNAGANSLWLVAAIVVIVALFPALTTYAKYKARARRSSK